MAFLRSVGLSLCVGAVAAAAAGLAPQLAAEAAPPPLARVDIGKAPANLRAGGDTARMNATVRQQSGGPTDCQRIRWSMAVRTPSGLDPADIQVTRNENGTVVPLDQARVDDALRLTDQRVDDGQLCRGRSVTAGYAVTVPDASVRGLVTLTVEALDEQGQRLGANTTSISITGGVVTPAGSQPADETGQVPADDGGQVPADSAGAAAAPPVRSASAVLPGQLPFVWFVVGGLIMSFSTGLLVRMFRRRRRAKVEIPYPARDRMTAAARRGLGYPEDFEEYGNPGRNSRRQMVNPRMPARRRSVLRV
ncbi:hypothetical protein GCM10010124_16500 [Pilimelia terevasa]|uniref:Uncharacterized protein n=1 Tax=Pilimelia terevasa TaxID=53372 RepID=A0A8J3BNP5_9ACTN|nr:hypothetical protein [Pilimelia terevasa]GGK24668.1 hypothetical protein GCM10010124_16500 [Pilimelia terevasa]